MPVPSLITDLSTTPGSNSPAGSESPNTADDYLRTYAAFIKQTYNAAQAAQADADAAQTDADTASTAAAAALPKAGGTMTGNLTMGAGTSIIVEGATDDAFETTLAFTDPTADRTITFQNATGTVAFTSDIPAAATLVPSGTVIYVGMSSAPTGYLKCNGAAVSRTTYADLFTAISTTFGVGDGTTTFNVPELRGEFIRGLDDSRGVDTARALGSAQSSANLAHTHSIYNTAGALEASPFDYVIGQAQTTYSTSSTLSSGGTEARPRNIALLACIKF